MTEEYIMREYIIENLKTAAKKIICEAENIVPKDLDDVYSIRIFGEITAEKPIVLHIEYDKIY